MKERMYSIKSKKNVKTDSDPYLAKEGFHGVALCKECHAIYKNKHWIFDEEEFKRLSILPFCEARNKNIASVICPACQKIKDKYAEGVVTLRGDFLKKHKEEILNLIRNEENRAKVFNPLERVIEIEESDDKIVITTTNEKIAQRIGREVYKAYQGDVKYKWSHDNKMVRVEWSRE